MADEFLSYGAMVRMLQSRLESMPQPLRILEAGCGRHWELQLSVPYSLTGIDLDRDALAARTDLHHAIVADLRTYDFPPRSFDVIYSAFVLEHVSGAEQVLERFERWLAPGGLLAIQVPDRDSAYGLLTRVTPHWAHVLVYRHVFGYRWAGTPGHGPYPTHHDEVISARGLRRFCARRGLPAPRLYRMCSYRRQRIVAAGAFVVSLLTAGRFAWRHNNLLALVDGRRSAEPSAAAAPADRSPRVGSLPAKAAGHSTAHA